MSKLLKFFIVLSVALIILSNFSYAFAAVDMNLGNNTSSTNSMYCFDCCWRFTYFIRYCDFN